MKTSLAINDIEAKSSDAVLDLIGDSTDLMRTQKRVEKKWDPTKKKYIASNNKEKMIKSESGQWIPVSYKSNRYEKWQEKSKAGHVEESDEENGTNKPTPSECINLVYDCVFVLRHDTCMAHNLFQTSLRG